MKKFECFYCNHDAVKYITFTGAISGISYTEGCCIRHWRLVGYRHIEITYEEFIAAKAMEAL